MNAPGNTLVVHVVSVTGLSIKGTKAVDIYCSLSTSGKGPWKSKVSTNTLRAEPQQFGAELRWDEHCEFQLNDTDTRLIVHVNHKTVFGTTETLGELIFQLDEMPRFQPPAWFRLSKVSSSDVQRGQIQLGYQFSNTLGIGGRQNGTSVSNMSLNKIEKENKLNRIRRKMQQLGRKATGAGGGSSQSTAGDDSQSLASISIAAGHSTTLSMGRRRSSVSSTNSGALAFSSPSPNPPTPVPATVDDFQRQQEQSSLQPTVQSSRKGAGNRNASTSNWTNTASSSGGGNSRTTSANGDGMVSMLDKNLSTTTTTATSEGQMTPTPRARLSRNFLQPPHQSHESAEFDDQTSMGGHSSVSGGSVFGGGHQLTSAADPQTPTPQQPPKLRVKMRQKAEQLLQLRSFTSSGKKHQQHEASNDPDLTLPDHSNGSRNAKKHQQQRRDSVASSSGFVSFGSGQLSTLNEQTSPEHLLNVIKHLRKELLQKEERIRDLEEYTDRLTSKVMTTNPELLATSPKIGAPRIRH